MSTIERHKWGVELWKYRNDGSGEAKYGQTFFFSSGELRQWLKEVIDEEDRIEACLKQRKGDAKD